MPNATASLIWRFADPSFKLCSWSDLWALQYKLDLLILNNKLSLGAQAPWFKIPTEFWKVEKVCIKFEPECFVLWSTWAPDVWNMCTVIVLSHFSAKSTHSLQGCSGTSAGFFLCLNEVDCLRAGNRSRRSQNIRALAGLAVTLRSADSLWTALQVKLCSAACVPARLLGLMGLEGDR